MPSVPGDVVEAVRGVVARQVLRRIDVEVEQIANRVGVFRPVQAVQARRRRVRRCGPVELVLEPGRHRLVDRRLGPARASRRHHARAELANHQLELFGVRVNVGQIEGIEGNLPRRIHTRGFRAFAVATHAVAIQQVAFGGRIERRRGALHNGRLRGRRCGGRRGPYPRRSRRRRLRRQRDGAGKSNETSNYQAVHLLTEYPRIYACQTPPIRRNLRLNH